jgi:hypothetical protein
MIVDFVSLVYILECGHCIIMIFMSWNKSLMLCILAAVICEFSIAMRASRASAMKRTDRQAIRTECQG